MATATISFPSEEAARNFLHWLDGQGEQDYWVWGDHQSDPENYVKKFTYDFKGLKAEGTN